MSNSTGGDARVSVASWRNEALNCGETKLLLLHENSILTSILIVSCLAFAVLFSLESMSPPQYFGDSFNGPRPLRNFYNAIILFVGSGSDSLPPFRALSFRIARASPSLDAVYDSSATRRHVSIISNNVQSTTTFSWYNIFIDLGLHVSILYESSSGPL